MIHTLLILTRTALNGLDGRAAAFLDEPTPDLFLDIQRMSWRLIKDQFYLQFLREGTYRHMLARRTHHNVRHTSGSSPLA
jgi:hypothetical protein